MEISEQLACLFSAKLEERDGRYVVEVPKQEVDLGNVDERETYRVALLSQYTESESETTAKTKTKTNGSSGSDRGPQGPPVDEGETRELEIEDIGEQGDGIARVERGYVVIVPDTEMGERVKVEITDVQENVAFADVVERLSYYE